jgi:hypothetical protein
MKRRIVYTMPMTLKDKLAAGLKCSKCSGPLVKSKHGFTGEVHCPKCSPNIEPVSPLTAVMALREKAWEGRVEVKNYRNLEIGGTLVAQMNLNYVSYGNPGREKVKALDEATRDLFVAAVNLLPELEKLLAEARLEGMEQAAQSVDEWNASIKNGDRVTDIRHVRAALAVASQNIRKAVADLR